MSFLIKIDNNQFNELRELVYGQLSYWEDEWDRLSPSIEGRDEVYYEFVLTNLNDVDTLLELVDKAVYFDDEDKK